MKNALLIGLAGAWAAVAVAHAAPTWEFYGGGEFPGAKGALAATNGVLHIDYDFTGGGHYVSAKCAFTPPISFREISLRGEWANETDLTLRFSDATGQSFQRHVPRRGDGRRSYVVGTHTFHAHWGGANDGVVHQPIKGMMLIAENRRGCKGGPVGRMTLSDIRFSETTYAERTAPTKPSRPFADLMAEAHALEGRLAAETAALEAKGKGAKSRASLAALRCFFRWIGEDVKRGFADRALREADELVRVGQAALERNARVRCGLEADDPQPKFVTSKLEIDGVRTIGERLWSDGRRDRGPLFFTGYGHFYHVQHDLEILPSLGNSILQMEFGPEHVFPTETTVNWRALENFDRVAERAAKANVQICLLLSPHYFPKWAHAKYPELADCKGGFFGYCVHDERAQALIEKYLRTVVPRLRGKSALHSLCLSNEPEQGHWGARCPLRKAFPEYLRSQYGTVAQLNATWKTSYTNFTDVTIPKNYVRMPPTAATLAFTAFSRERFAAFHRRMASVVRELAPGIPLHSKVMIHVGFSDSATFRSVDPDLFAQWSDYNGNDCSDTYRFGELEPWAHEWWPMEAGYDHQRAAADKPIFNTEDHIIPDREIGAVPPRHIATTLWQNALHGQNATTLWAWDRAYDAGKSDFNGLILERPECFVAWAHTALDLSRLADVIVPIQEQQPEILVHRSDVSVSLDHFGSDLFFECYRGVAFLGRPFGVCTDAMLAKAGDAGKATRPFAAARIVLLPKPVRLTDAARAGLKRLAAEGVRVLACGTLPLKNEFGDERKAEGIELLNATEDEKIFAALRPKIASFANDGHPLLRGGDGLPGVWGVETHGYEKGGKRYLALVNHKNDEVAVDLPFGGRDLINGACVSDRIRLASETPMFVEAGEEKGAFVILRNDPRLFRIHGSPDETKATKAMMRELAAEVKRVTGTDVQVLHYAPAAAGDFFVATQPWDAQGAWTLGVRNGIVGIHGSDPAGTEAALRHFIDTRLKGVATGSGRLAWPNGMRESHGPQAEDVREATVRRVREERVRTNAPDWANELVNAVGVEPARAYTMPLASVRDALSGDLPATPFVASLDGTWQYKWSPDVASRPSAFWQTDYDCSGWDAIDVPSCVEAKGYGQPLYSNIRYPHPATPPDPGATNNYVSSYRRTFDLPEHWKGRDVHLRFEGVYSAYYVWVNGQKVGYAEDSCTAHEFDITSLVRPKGNILAVEVYRWSDGAFLEDQDFLRYSGIFRHVMLFATPKTAIRDFRLKYELAADFRSVKMNLATELTGPAEPVRAALYDAASRKVCDLAGETVLDAPHLWSAETPYLYTLVLEAGEDVRAAKVGFMKSEIAANGAILINGRPVKFRGVNRHDASAVNGRAVTRQEMLWDVLTMKRNNIDTVRTAHYPNDPYFYALCAKYGLYVVAEANVESHGMHYGVRSLASPPSWTQAQVDRCRDMVINWRHLPCVFMWSWGNEAGQGPTFDVIDAACRALDDSRPTAYRQDCERFAIDGPGYPTLAEVRKRGQNRKCNFFFEYAHAMGNALGNFDEYWDEFYRSPSLTGGCIWDWVDQALWKDDGHGGRFLAYGGDFDDQPNDGNFCVNGLVTADRHPTAKLAEVKHVQRNLVVTRRDDGSFELWNRHAFTAADAFQGKWRLRRDGRVTAEGTFAVPPTPPQTRERLALPELEGKIRALDAEHDAHVDFLFSLRRDASWAPKGHVVADDQIVLRTREGGRAEKGSLVGVTADAAGNAVLAKGSVRAVFSRATGELTALTHDGTPLLAPGTTVRLTCARALTDNDKWLRGSFEKSGLAAPTYTCVSCEANATSVRTTTRVSGTQKCGLLHHAEWRLREDGTLEVTSDVEPFGTLPILPRLGLSLVLPSDCERVDWLGRGPHENYVDRKSSAFFGVWSSTVRGLYEPYCRPQDNGYRSDVRKVAFCRTSGLGGLEISADAPFYFQALHCRMEDLDRARHRAGETKRRVPLPERAEAYVNVDWLQLGLGEGSCGPKPEAKYIPSSAASRFTLRLRPF